MDEIMCKPMCLGIWVWVDGWDLAGCKRFDRLRRPVHANVCVCVFDCADWMDVSNFEKFRRSQVYQSLGK